MALERRVPSSVGEVHLFPDVGDVIRGLVTLTDWWQPNTTSILQVGAARRASGFGDGLRDGLRHDRRTIHSPEGSEGWRSEIDASSSSGT